MTLMPKALLLIAALGLAACNNPDRFGAGGAGANGAGGFVVAAAGRGINHNFDIFSGLPSLCMTCGHKGQECQQAE